MIWWKPTIGCSKPSSPICLWKRSTADGFADLTDDEAFEGLDDYVYGTLARLYREVYQEDPLQSERKRQMNKKVAISGLF